MNFDFIEPITKSIDVINTASRITKIVNLVKTLIYAVAASLILVNVVSLVRKQF